MQQRFNVSASTRNLGAGALAITMLAALTACGGDGDDTPATVTSMSVAATKYGIPALITVVGTHLGNLTITAPGCKNLTRLTTGATVSTDTTSYYSCTPSGTYSSTVTAISNGAAANTQTLTVNPPIVTMQVVGGGGVNGTIVFNLKGNVAPVTVDNFLAYVNSHFYDGLIFHRVANFNNPQSGLAPYFVVQGGGYGPMTSGTLPTPKTPTFAPIALETTGGGNIQWTAAMARGNGANTAQSEFFFNVANNTNAFDTSAGPGYAVFADVSASAAIITQITQATCTTLTAFNDGSCVPIPNVTITSATQTQ